MSVDELPGRLQHVGRDRELPRREDLPSIFDELDYQMACQAYLWALPLVASAQWQKVSVEIFGATASDLVVYRTYRDRLGILTANATTPYILSFVDLGATGPLVIELPAGPTAGGVSDFWQREIATLGEMGPEKGAGGKHLVLPPGGEEPEDSDAIHATPCHRNEHPVRPSHPRRGRRPSPSARREREDLPSTPTDRTRRRPDCSRPVAVHGRATNPGECSTGNCCTTSTNARSSTNATGSTSRCSPRSASRRTRPSNPDERLTRILTAAASDAELMAQANTFAKRFPGSAYWPDRRWDLVLAVDDSSQRAVALRPTPRTCLLVL